MTTDDDLPPEYREDVPDDAAPVTPLPPTLPEAEEPPEEPSPRISVLPQPPESESDRKHREAMAFFREGIEQAKKVTEAQKKLAPVIAEAGRRIDAMRERQHKLDQLDAAVAILKSIEFPEPYDSILDLTVEELRKAIHNLYPAE